MDTYGLIAEFRIHLSMYIFAIIGIDCHLRMRHYVNVNFFGHKISYIHNGNDTYRFQSIMMLIGFKSREDCFTLFLFTLK